MRKFFYTLLLIAFVVLVKSCATPRGPTGGEPDQEGPNIVKTDPASGTTNFDGDEVQFQFDQFVDRNSVRQNVNIEPDLGIEYEVDFRRKKATVKFLSPLPDSTTIIVKLGTEVTDTDRNEMDAPYELALSTGPVLDNATITGKLLDAQTGKGATGNRVFLYPEPFDLSQRAIYIAETDTSGQIRFGYLSAGTYKAFWVNDLNRNRIWEEQRESAQPFHSETFSIEQDDSLDIGTIYVSSPDTVSPELEGVGLLTEIRLRLRFTEEVQLEESASFVLTDTLGNEFTRAVPLYKSEQDATVLFAQSLKALSDSLHYLIRSDGVTDKAGNQLKIDIAPFIGSSQADTTSLSTVSHNAGSGLFPDEPLEVTYSRFINDDAVVDSLTVVEGDVVNNNWEPLEVDNHILRISPQQRWDSGINYQFRVWNPFLEERENIDPDIWQRNQLGGIELSLENSDSTITSRLLLTDAQESIRVDTTFTSSILIDNLPPLRYKAIVFEDMNENGKWNQGIVVPYSAPEPYGVRDAIPVQEGFTAEVTISYRPRTDSTEAAGPEELPEESEQ